MNCILKTGHNYTEKVQKVHIVKIFSKNSFTVTEPTHPVFSLQKLYVLYWNSLYRFKLLYEIPIGDPIYVKKYD